MSAPDLLDVNVWLALANPWHTHHEAAQNYWATAAPSDAPMAFCRTSMQGFLRLVTSSVVMGRAVHTPQEAWDIYQTYLNNSRTMFLAEPVTIESQMRRYTLQPGFQVRDWTDAWLASFAVTAGCRMVSFDSGFQKYDGLDFLLLRGE